MGNDSSDVPRQDDLNFDLRSVVSDASAFDGKLRVMSYSIGGEPIAARDAVSSGDVRTMTEERPDDGARLIQEEHCFIFLNHGCALNEGNLIHENMSTPARLNR